MKLKQILLSQGYLLKNGFWVSCRYGIVTLLGLLMTILFTRLAEKEIYGAYQYLISLMALFSIFSLPGMNMAALQSVVQGKYQAIFQAIRMSFVGALLGTVAFLGFGWLQGNEKGIPLEIFFFLAIIFPPLYASNTWYVFYEGKQDFFSVAWRVILMNLFIFAATAVALIMQAPLFVVVATYFLSMLSFSIFFCWEIWRRLRPVITSEVLDTPTLDRRYGYMMTLQKSVFTFTETFPIVLVTGFFGFSAAALLQVAVFLYGALSGYIGAIAAMYLPQLFQGMRLTWGRLLLTQMSAGGVITIALAGFLIIGFEPLFGAEYHESRTLAWMLLPTALLLPLRSYLNNYFIANKRVGLLLWIYALANIGSIGIFLLLQPQGLLISIAAYLILITLVTVGGMLLAYGSETAERKTVSIS